MAEPLEGMCECSSRVSEHDLPAGLKLLWQALKRILGTAGCRAGEDDPDGQQAAVSVVTRSTFLPSGQI